MKKHALEAVTLVAAAVICAVVANAVASTQRKVAVVGDYPNALKVPVVSESGATTVTVPATVTTASPAPAAPPITITTVTTPSPADAGGPPNNAAVAAQPRAHAPAQAPPVNLAQRFPPHPDKPYVEIRYDDVAALYRSGALFLDARRTSVFEEGHIAGARPFSVWEADIDQKVNALFEDRGDPREQLEPIVIYCSGGECEDSHMLAQKLWGVQFNNVYVYKDGFPDWQKRGGPVRTGPKP